MEEMGYSKTEITAKKKDKEKESRRRRTAEKKES